MLVTKVSIRSEQNEEIQATASSDQKEESRMEKSSDGWLDLVTLWQSADLFGGVNGSVLAIEGTSHLVFEEEATFGTNEACLESPHLEKQRR